MKTGLAVMGRMLLFWGLLAPLAGSAGDVMAVSDAPARQRYVLRAAAHWQLNPPGKIDFGASGLVLQPDGTLLTVRDREATPYQIQFLQGTNAVLKPLPDCFSPSQLAPFRAQKTGYYDTEGIARDEQNRIYICEEQDRWILRWDPKNRRVERLEIDWAPVKKYFDPEDRNASFEGVACAGGLLYVANERQMPRILVVDLQTLKVRDDFLVQASRPALFGPHYSDLSWFENALFVLLRQDRVVLKVDPATHAVLAEYDYQDLELDPEVRYLPYSPLYETGVMEGLAVDDHFIWLATDNNGKGRRKYPKDTRPTLFKCPRPDRAK